MLRVVDSSDRIRNNLVLINNKSRKGICVGLSAADPNFAGRNSVSMVRSLGTES